MSADNYKPDCPFCSKRKEDFFLEDEDFAAICSISPILPGHSLIIPKSHRESIFELVDEDLTDLMHMGRNTAKLLSEIFHTDSFDFFIQEKRQAGQSIPHLHMHVVPRKTGDLKEPGDWYPEFHKRSIESEGFQLQPDQIFDITQRLKKLAKEMKIKD